MTRCLDCHGLGYVTCRYTGMRTDHRGHVELLVAGGESCSRCYGTGRRTRRERLGRVERFKRRLLMERAAHGETGIA
jgi:hypothetical protein